MLQMTQHINADWKTPRRRHRRHLLHLPPRQPVPANIWFERRRTPRSRRRCSATRPARTRPTPSVGYASLPYDPFTTFPRRHDEHPRRRRRPRCRAGNRRVDQADRGDLRPDDAHVEVARRQLHLLPQHALVRRLGLEHAAARDRLVRHPHGARPQRRLYLDSLTGVFPPNRLGPHGDVPRSTARPATRACTSRWAG